MFFSIILSSCEGKKALEELNPIAFVSLLDSIGNTTTIFELDATLSTSGNSGDKLFFRWDWDGDGLWDEPFSSNPISHHRFFEPKLYTSVLEVLNSSGLTDSVSMSIQVTQGFSAPRARFSITPEAGNPLTEFYFDARSSDDDEDSLSQLLFRWDWEGDGHWDTKFDASSSKIHQYAELGSFLPILEVIDPKRLKSEFSKRISINNINPSLQALFDWVPIHPIENDTVLFDAKQSKNMEDLNSSLIYYWKVVKGNDLESFENDSFEGWVGPSQTPEFSQKFTQEGVYLVGLRIQDNNKLVNKIVKKIEVFHKNRPPVPKINVSSDFGNLTTQFVFNGWETSDIEDLSSTIRIRWDFNGDKTWDTGFSLDKVAYHQYAESGYHQVIMEAMDPHGVSDTTSILIRVSNGTNETGVLLDRRWGADEYYSTVKIGEQWWMSENMKYAPYRYTSKVDTLASTCYRDESHYCDIHGGLYTAYSATQLNDNEKVQGICPEGWHIPALPEWEILIAEIGGVDNIENLLVGGSSDFNATLPGYSYKRSIGTDPRGNPVFKWFFKGLGSIGYYWTSTTPRGDLKKFNHWTVTFMQEYPYYSQGISGNSTFFSLRCIKD